jgi:hypothetical protein
MPNKPDIAGNCFVRYVPRNIIQRDVPSPCVAVGIPEMEQINQGMPDPHSASPAFALQTLFLMFYTLELLIQGVVFGFEKYTLKTNRLTSCAEHYPSLQH